MKVLVTGVAGFIGYHLTKALVRGGHTVLGIDNINDYYDIRLKIDRLKELGIERVSDSCNSNLFPALSFQKVDLTEPEKLISVLSDYNPELVIHLAAQAGVRYSIDNPDTYLQSNVNGFYHLLEVCRKLQINKLIYASSSSVYGNSLESPYHEEQSVSAPVSLYAASKVSNELFAHVYSQLYKIQTYGLRFFTVYGPFGRPDMAYFSFSKAILNDIPIKVFNNGNLSRDFTYIDDVIEGIIRLSDKIVLEGNDLASNSIFNIGNSTPVKLMDFIATLEVHLGKKAVMDFAPMQQGDVYETFANVSKLQNFTGYHPQTSINEGLKNFVEWYKSYYHQ